MLKNQKCKYCNKLFDQTSSKNQRYCSPACYYIDRRIGKHINCLICNKIIYVMPSDKDRKYCSNKCKGVGQKKGKIIKCLTCGNEIYVTSSQINKKFCSRSCMGKFNIKYSLLPYRKQNPKAPMSIEGSKRRSDVMVYLWKNDINYRNNITEKVSGSNCHLWQGGISFAPYSIEFTNKLKEKIRKRDNYTCQLCNKTEEDHFRKLDIHHIDYNKENCEPENLISLCSNCNAKVNSNRVYWTNYFKPLSLQEVY